MLKKNFQHTDYTKCIKHTTLTKSRIKYIRRDKMVVKSNKNSFMMKKLGFIALF